MASIQLTRGFTALVDDSDLPLLAGYKWYAALDTRREHWRAQARRPGGGTVLMHHLILPPPPGRTVDHVAHPWPAEKVIDNRRANLRLATKAENSANARKRRAAASSRFKGVVRRGSKWLARIGSAGGTILGRFSTEEEAARAYDAAARALYGDFARLNLP